MIGDNIKKYRKRAGLTQKQLAEKLGLKEITIRQYESNRREPKHVVLTQIADILNVTMVQLLEENATEHFKAMEQERKAEDSFIAYMESLGYDVVNPAPPGEGTNKYIIYPKGGKRGISITLPEFGDLREYMADQLDFELTRVQKRKDKK